MESQRSKKSRSLGVDAVPPRQVPTSNRRPDLGERTYSAPTVAQNKHSTASRLSQSSKNSERTKLSSKTNSRDGKSLVVSESQSSDRHGYTAQSAKGAVNTEDLPLFNLIVLGHTKVGKTGFVRNALDLRKPNISHISTSKVCLGGLLYRVQLLELLVSDIELIGADQIRWPKYVNGVPFPVVDGVFVLYDVTDEDSLASIPQLLATLNESEYPCLLVSCKIDCSEDEREVGPAFTKQVRKRFDNVEVAEASIDSSESAKRCLLQVMKAILGGVPTLDDKSPKASRPGSRAPSVGRTHNSSRASSTSRSRSRNRPHASRSKSRDKLAAVSQTPRLPTQEPNPTEEEKSKSPSKVPLKVDTSTKIGSPIQQAGPQTPVSFSDPQISTLMSPSDRAISTVPETPESYTEYAIRRPGTASTADSKTYNTFLNMDDESISEEFPEQEAGATNTSNKLQQLTLQESNVSEGAQFGDLVDRLLSMPTTKGASKFVPSFLCLYRAFATPTKLLTAIVDRFLRIERSDMVQFTKVAEQLRYLSVLAQWTANYPGDFANPAVRELAVTFVKDIEKVKNFAPAAKEISNSLQLFIADEDDDWAYSDVPQSARSRTNTSTHKTSSTEALSKVTSRSGKQLEIENSDSEGDVDMSVSSPQHSGTTSSASSLLKAGNPSSQSAINLLNLEFAREQARKLKTIPHLRLSKVQWHQFVETPTVDIALEITRIDWTMYQAIRPRDFVRQATASTTQRTRTKQIDAISMMTKHFNHLTFFVSAMILLRDKPKHRAKMLEKFMDLAWKVRQMNNYQSLGAIVAAIKGEEINRLTQTHDLISPEIQKSFWKLKILMDHQKSHAAYRMAWENSPRERIPFLPRVQEDLTKAALGNPTFIGNNVKWAKFEVMGETIITVQRSQEQTYSFPDRTQKSQETCRLILETKVIEGPEDSDDPRYELYERSKQIEPLTATTDGKKKFDWLRR